MIIQAATDPEFLLKLQWQKNRLDILERAIQNRAKYLDSAEDRVRALLQEMQSLLDTVPPSVLP